MTLDIVLLDLIISLSSPLYGCVDPFNFAIREERNTRTEEGEEDGNMKVVWRGGISST